MYWIASLTTTNTLSLVFVSMSAFNCSICRLMRPVTFSTKGDLRWRPGPATRTNLPNRSTMARSCCSTVKKKRGIRRSFQICALPAAVRANDEAGDRARPAGAGVQDPTGRRRDWHIPSLDPFRAMLGTQRPTERVSSSNLGVDVLRLCNDGDRGGVGYA